MMALYARSFCKNTQTESIVLPSTMDLRKFIPAGVKYGISNYSGDCMCRISIGRKDGLAETIVQISKQMQAYKSGNDVLKPALLWTFVAACIPYPALRHIFRRNAKHPIIFYTNTGIIDEELLNFHALPIKETYMMAAIMRRPYLTLLISTYKNRCTMTCNIYGSPEDRRFADRLLDDICAEAGGL